MNEDEKLRAEKLRAVKERLEQKKAEGDTSRTPVWEPTEVGATLTGVVVEIKKDLPTRFGKNDLIVVETEAGEILGVWTKKRLAKDFARLKVGSAIGLVYRGKRPGGQKTPYDDFDVEIVE